MTGGGGDNKKSSGRKPERGNGGGWGKNIRRESAVNEGRKGAAGLVARHQAKYNSSWDMYIYICYEYSYR